MPINCYSRLPHRVEQAQKISLRELHTKGPLASVAMASVQCFKKAEKSYYQQNRCGQRSEHAKSHAEWYGQREDHFPLRRGYMAEGYGDMAQGHGYSAQNHGYSAQGLGYSAQGHGDMALAQGQGFLAQGLGSMVQGFGHVAQGLGQQVQGLGHVAQGLGHKVQAQSAYKSGLATVESQTACKGRNNGRYLSEFDQNDSMGQKNGRYLSQFDQNHSMGQSNGRYLAQQAQTQSIAEFQGNQREFSSCHAKTKKKTEHRKKEKFMMMHREFRTRDERCSDGSGSESDNDRW
ncbi:hypothetical protein EUGRSUZ_D01722 [Eucalyptus grandis]|uniref:Uncharacterized protein n=1 Tax=Eucalyptus grandis TaxID=71139 RepID=A0A059CFY2_EUCGR|nr:hypothetical protein EUGRSUZ_D01722 [Eucalyptus grandis]